MRNLLRALLPDKLYVFFFHTLLKRSIWVGEYSNWAEALNAVDSGYEDMSIVERVVEAKKYLLENPDFFERDGIIVSGFEPSESTVRGILLSKELLGSSIHIMDIGGSLGTTYHNYARFLKDIVNLRYTIVEQSMFVEQAKLLKLEDEVLRFTTDMKSNKPIDVVVLSSVLPYVESAKNIMQSVIGLNPSIIIIEKTFISEDIANDRIAVQYVSPKIYNAAYPCWVFAKEAFERFFVQNGFREYFSDSIMFKEGFYFSDYVYIRSDDGQ